MTFEEAISKLKKGAKVQRKNWENKDMYIFQIHHNQWKINSDHKIVNELETMPTIAMKTARNKISPWLASQADIFANDWRVAK